MKFFFVLLTIASSSAFAKFSAYNCSNFKLPLHSGVQFNAKCTDSKYVEFSRVRISHNDKKYPVSLNGVENFCEAMGLKFNHELSNFDTFPSLTGYGDSAILGYKNNSLQIEAIDSGYACWKTIVCEKPAL